MAQTSSAPVAIAEQEAQTPNHGDGTIHHLLAQARNIGSNTDGNSNHKDLALAIQKDFVRTKRGALKDYLGGVYSQINGIIGITCLVVICFGLTRIFLEMKQVAACRKVCCYDMAMPDEK